MYKGNLEENAVKQKIRQKNVNIKLKPIFCHDSIQLSSKTIHLFVGFKKINSFSKIKCL